MTKARLPNGQETTTDDVASDVEFMRRLVAFSDQIAAEINLLFNKQKAAEAFNRLKAAVGEMHALLSTVVAEEDIDLISRLARAINSYAAAHPDVTTQEIKGALADVSFTVGLLSRRRQVEKTEP